MALEAIGTGSVAVFREGTHDASVRRAFGVSADEEWGGKLHNSLCFEHTLRVLLLIYLVYTIDY